MEVDTGPARLVRAVRFRVESAQHGAVRWVLYPATYEAPTDRVAPWRGLPAEGTVTAYVVVSDDPYDWRLAMLGRDVRPADHVVVVASVGVLTDPDRWHAMRTQPIWVLSRSNGQSAALVTVGRYPIDGCPRLILER
jgi:hypothetical protein